MNKPSTICFSQILEIVTDIPTYKATYYWKQKFQVNFLKHLTVAFLNIVLVRQRLERTDTPSFPSIPEGK